MLWISQVDYPVSCLSGLPWAARMFGIVCAAHDMRAGFILVKSDPGEGKCIMLAGQEQWWPRGKVTAVGDYLINMVVLCSGQAPRTGFRVRGAVCVAGDGSDLSPPGSVTLLCSPGSCCSPRIANPAKNRAGESFSPFYKAIPGIWAVWWVLSPALWRAGKGVCHRHCPGISLWLCAPSFSWPSLFVWLIAVVVNCNQN